MKLFSIILFIILFTSLTSCNKNYWDDGYPCSFCYNIKPEEALLSIDLTINNKNAFVPITILKGKLEEKDTIWTDTTNQTKYELYVPVDNYYTVTAEYNWNDKKVIAVDGDKVFLRKNQVDCDTTCWIIFDAYLNVKLKYE
ncbi:MAG: hypothetical protein GXO79_04310 [Chlorobi bacterium]|nr:hypothetical protein [Chlorobiota bacterium]